MLCISGRGRSRSSRSSTLVVDSGDNDIYMILPLFRVCFRFFLLSLRRLNGSERPPRRAVHSVKYYSRIIVAIVTYIHTMGDQFS